MDGGAECGRERYQRLLIMARRLPPVATAVVHPCDAVSLAGAVEAYRLGLIAPTLVAPPARLADLARQNDIDITGLPVVASEHSHDSAAKAVGLVREGKAEALMKGSLHTDEVMGAVVAHDSGIKARHR